ncbi:MAG: PDDEXK nuclease domain-containing protein [Thiothrix sp.]|uniref:PDDEXK nuclease domain-containing protein n=1 Tax=Thiothrix sp. TaxID=1032 RepID=UPI00261F39CC|nr:PDDEXK nuclease domain-containing protein [Thiothrix sp.]MDD5391789.1 PDDEXK nuclease domain-containing protein [Thiothrix sp.]
MMEQDKNKLDDTPVALTPLPAGYQDWLASLKTRIHTAQQRATLAVNRELVLLYWQIGQEILTRQSTQGWGAKVIDHLAHDLRVAFPEMKGFSPRNLKYMRTFAQNWGSSEFVQEVLAQLPWYHHITLLDKLKTQATREWYAQQAITHNWSRNVLVMQIETNLMDRSGKAVNNFAQCLPAPQSDLARESLKDPYRLDFLGLGQDAQERAVEAALVEHITQFLLELGAGFAFVGKQVHVVVGGEDFYLDLLFYHLKLRCYVVVELKAGDFKPEHTGQISFYLSAVDSLLKHPDDQPSIGLLLCKNHNRIVAEYALRDSHKPIGIAQYQLGDAIPSELKIGLPTIEQIEQELSNKTPSQDKANHD